MSGLRRFIGDRGGATALEFALIGLPFIMLMLGLIEFGRGLHIRNGLDNAVDRAQRILLIDPGAAAGSIETEVRAAFRAGSQERLTVAITGSPSGGNIRTLTVTFQMDLLLPAPIGRTISIGSARQVVIAP